MAGVAVPLPAAERRQRDLVLDRAPEPTGPLQLTPLSCYACEQADSEDPPRAVAEVSSSHEDSLA